MADNNVVVMQEPDTNGEYIAPEAYLAMAGQEFHLYYDPSERLQPPQRLKEIINEMPHDRLEVLPKTLIINEEDKPDLKWLEGIIDKRVPVRKMPPKYEKIDLSVLFKDMPAKNTVEFRSHDLPPRRCYYVRPDGSVVEITGAYGEGKTREDVEREYPHLMQWEYRGIGKYYATR